MTNQIKSLIRKCKDVARNVSRQLKPRIKKFSVALMLSVFVVSSYGFIYETQVAHANEETLNFIKCVLMNRPTSANINEIKETEKNPVNKEDKICLKDPTRTFDITGESYTTTTAGDVLNSILVEVFGKPTEFISTQLINSLDNDDPLTDEKLEDWKQFEEYGDHIGAYDLALEDPPNADSSLRYIYEYYMQIDELDGVDPIIDSIAFTQNKEREFKEAVTIKLKKINSDIIPKFLGLFTKHQYKGTDHLSKCIDGAFDNDINCHEFVTAGDELSSLEFAINNVSNPLMNDHPSFLGQLTKSGTPEEKKSANTITHAGARIIMDIALLAQLLIGDDIRNLKELANTESPKDKYINYLRRDYYNLLNGEILNEKEGLLNYFYNVDDGDHYVTPKFKDPKGTHSDLDEFFEFLPKDENLQIYAPTDENLYNTTTTDINTIKSTSKNTVKAANLYWKYLADQSTMEFNTDLGSATHDLDNFTATKLPRYIYNATEKKYEQKQLSDMSADFDKVKKLCSDSDIFSNDLKDFQYSLYSFFVEYDDEKQEYLFNFLDAWEYTTELCSHYEWEKPPNLNETYYDDGTIYYGNSDISIGAGTKTAEYKSHTYPGISNSQNVKNDDLKKFFNDIDITDKESLNFKGQLYRANRSSNQSLDNTLKNHDGEVMVYYNNYKDITFNENNELISFEMSKNVEGRDNEYYGDGSGGKKLLANLYDKTWYNYPNANQLVLNKDHFLHRGFVIAQKLQFAFNYFYNGLDVSWYKFWEDGSDYLGYSTLIKIINAENEAIRNMMGGYYLSDYIMLLNTGFSDNDYHLVNNLSKYKNRNFFQTVAYGFFYGAYYVQSMFCLMNPMESAKWITCKNGALEMRKTDLLEMSNKLEIDIGKSILKIENLADQIENISLQGLNDIDVYRRYSLQVIGEVISIQNEMLYFYNEIMNLGKWIKKTNRLIFAIQTAAAVLTLFVGGGGMLLSHLGKITKLATAVSKIKNALSNPFIKLIYKAIKILDNPFDVIKLKYLKKGTATQKLLKLEAKQTNLKGMLKTTKNGINALEANKLKPSLKKLWRRMWHTKGRINRRLGRISKKIGKIQKIDDIAETLDLSKKLKKLNKLEDIEDVIHEPTREKLLTYFPDIADDATDFSKYTSKLDDAYMTSDLAKYNHFKNIDGVADAKKAAEEAKKVKKSIKNFKETGITELKTNLPNEADIVNAESIKEVFLQKTTELKIPLNKEIPVTNTQINTIMSSMDNPETLNDALRAMLPPSSAESSVDALGDTLFRLNKDKKEIQKLHEILDTNKWIDLDNPSANFADDLAKQKAKIEKLSTSATNPKVKNAIKEVTKQMKYIDDNLEAIHYHKMLRHDQEVLKKTIQNLSDNNQIKTVLNGKELKLLEADELTKLSKNLKDSKLDELATKVDDYIKQLSNIEVLAEGARGYSWLSKIPAFMGIKKLNSARKFFTWKRSLVIFGGVTVPYRAFFMNKAINNCDDAQKELEELESDRNSSDNANELLAHNITDVLHTIFGSDRGKEQANELAEKVKNNLLLTNQLNVHYIPKAFADSEILYNFMYKMKQTPTLASTSRNQKIFEILKYNAKASLKNINSKLLEKLNLGFRCQDKAKDNPCQPGHHVAYQNNPRSMFSSTFFNPAMLHATLTSDNTSFEYNVNCVPDWNPIPIGTVNIGSFNAFAGGVLSERTGEHVIARIIKIFIVFAGGLAVLAIIYAGLLYAYSNGEEEMLTKSKSIWTSALIGLIVTMLSYFAVAVVEGIFYSF